WLKNLNCDTAGGNGAQSTAAGAASVNMNYLGAADWWGIVAMDVVAAGGVPDTTPPTVSVTAPSNGATVSSSTSVTATASDNVGVAGVQFKLDGSNLGAEDTSSPYSISWDTTATLNGSHS